MSGLIQLVADNPPNHSRFRRHWHRLIQVGTGHAIYGAFNFIFDQIVYVYIVYRLGLLVGGIIMTSFSLMQCAATLVLYERMKIDWVGAGSLANISIVTKPAWWQRMILWAERRGKFVIFFALCVFQDPFITTAYFRRGRFDGLQLLDWKIFFASVLVSNVYWTLRSGLMAAILVRAWGLFS